MIKQVGFFAMRLYHLDLVRLKGKRLRYLFVHGLHVCVSHGNEYIPKPE